MTQVAEKAQDSPLAHDETDDSKPAALPGSEQSVSGAANEPDTIQRSLLVGVTIDPTINGFSVPDLTHKDAFPPQQFTATAAIPPMEQTNVETGQRWAWFDLKIELKKVPAPQALDHLVETLKAVFARFFPLARRILHHLS